MRAKHKAVPKVEKEALKACVGEGEQQKNGSCDLLSLFTVEPLWATCKCYILTGDLPSGKPDGQ